MDIRVFKILRDNMAIQLLITLSVALLLNTVLPATLQAFFYSISFTLNNLLLFILPAIIFICVFTSFSGLRAGNSFKFIVVLITFVFVSNYLSTLIAYAVGSLKLVGTSIPVTYLKDTKTLLPLWEVKFSEWLSNNTALYLGFILGSFCSFFPTKFTDQLSISAKRLVNFFLEKFFIRILPLFAFGFILKMQFEGMITQCIRSCMSLLLLLTLTYVLYFAFLFSLLAKFKFEQWIKYIKNTLPSALTGFSTMSSLATLPVTLNAAEKNTANPHIGQSVLPITVNIHLIGLAINIPLMALTLLTNFKLEFPSFTLYAQFALDFIVSQLAIAAAPGCGIIVMIPLLESYFGFTGEMSAFIIALYILFDAIETSANVVGNSILTIIMSKIYPRFNFQITMPS